MAALRGLVQRLDQELHRSGLLPRGGKLLVAVSGGADSVALLRLLVEINGSDYWGWKLAVGHVEHGIRGAASKADAAWVKELAGELGISFLLRTLKVAKGASEGTLRAKRWAALGAMAKKAKCSGIVTAHHADDQAETVLMRMMRGCGLDGLRGIPADSSVGDVLIYRPLLAVRRGALRDYLKEIGQGWREDETNRSTDYTRNRVRLELLPLMESLYAGATESLMRMSTIAGEGWSFISDVAASVWLDAFVESGRPGQRFDRTVLRESGPVICAETLRLAVQVEGGSTESADFERVREAVRIVQGSHGAKVVELGRGVILRVAGGLVTVERGDSKKKKRGRR